jgi:hypothetical protein
MAQGSAVTHGMMWNSKGKRLGEATLAGERQKSVFIKRVPLGMILAEEAERQGITIERGKKLGGIEVTNTGSVVATFQKRHHRERRSPHWWRWCPLPHAPAHRPGLLRRCLHRSHEHRRVHLRREAVFKPWSGWLSVRSVLGKTAGGRNNTNTILSLFVTRCYTICLRNLTKLFSVPELHNCDGQRGPGQ